MVSLGSSKVKSWAKEAKGQQKAAAMGRIMELLKGKKGGFVKSGRLEPTLFFAITKYGRVAERFNVPDSKSGVGATLPWVQIPPRPSLRGRGKDLHAGGGVRFAPDKGLRGRKANSNRIPIS